MSDLLWNYRCLVLDVHDGDTVKVFVDKGGKDYAVWDIRLSDVYAPELKQAGGPETRDHLRALVAGRQTSTDWPWQWKWIVHTERLLDDSGERKTFERYVGRIWPLAGGESLNNLIQHFVVTQGYDGGIGS